MKTLTLALVLCAAPLYAADTKNIDKTLPLNANGAVTLATHNGSVQIRTWDRSDLEVHVQIEAHGTSSDARRRFEETTADIDGSRDIVSIKTRTPDLSGYGLWSWLMSSGDWDTSPEIRYTINAPRTARWTIRNHNAKLDLRDVSAAVDLATHNGSVWAANLNGPLALSMHNGDAHIDFASFTRESHISTHNASVEVALPASTKFDLHSSGHNVHVQSDFPATVRASDFGGHSISSQVNGGGPELRLTAHNGSFRLQSK